MKNTGWIKIFRKIEDNPIYKDSELLHLFIHCILKANHKEKTFLFNGKEITIKRGQFVTGRFELSRATKIKTSSVYRKLKILEKLQILDIKSNNKFSIVTVLKYNSYQDTKNESEHLSEQQLNNKRTTTEQQLNTNKNVKNVKNVKNDNQSKKDSDPADDKFEKALKDFNVFAMINDLPKCLKLSGDRLTNLKDRLNESEFNMTAILEKAKESEWLMTKTDPKFNIDFIISNDINYIKILEGKFNGKIKESKNGLERRNNNEIGNKTGQSDQTGRSADFVV